MSDVVDELPGVLGFWSDDVLDEDQEERFIRILSCYRYSNNRRQAVRVRTNLIVLFRVLLFHLDLRHSPNFWSNVKQDWDLGIRFTTSDVAEIADYYTDCGKTKSELNFHSGLDLLIRLIDRWGDLRGVLACPRGNLNRIWRQRRRDWRVVLYEETDRIFNETQPLILSVRVQSRVDAAEAEARRVIFAAEAAREAAAARAQAAGDGSDSDSQSSSDESDAEARTGEKRSAESSPADDRPRNRSRPCVRCWDDVDY